SFTEAGLSGRDDLVSSVRQPDGKIVAVGATAIDQWSYMATVRYNADGTLDNTFNGNGVALLDTPDEWDGAASVALQPDGKILVAGNVLARYNSDGSLDTTFNGTGWRTEPGISGYHLGNDGKVAVQGDGKIVVAASGDFRGNNFVVDRFNSD